MLRHGSVVPARRLAALALSAFFCATCVSPAESFPGDDGGPDGAGAVRGSGGHPSTGGAVGSGGTPGTSSGGRVGSGGHPSATGGVSSGGVPGSGGAASGGAPGSGGRDSTGGHGAGAATGGGTAGRGAASGGTSGRGGGGTAGRTGTGGTGTPLPAGKKFVGNIDTRGQVRTDFSMYWNQISPENAGKWGSIEGTRNQMSWAALDRIHDYAKQNNLPFKQHNFVWGSQQPTWLNSLSQADQKAEVEEWIRLFCERYPDTQLIDVVNEPPPHTMPVYMAALGGAGTSGYDWIVQAFKWAHQYCPKATLILNDYNNIETSNDNAHTIDIVKKILAAGAPINAIGAQAHGTAGMQTSTVQMYVDRLKSETGLPVYITEFDLNIADDNQQKTVMQNHFTMFWNDANVAGITIWGYVVGATWQTNTGLMTSANAMRPAMTWLMSFLGR